VFDELTYVCTLAEARQARDDIAGAFLHEPGYGPHLMEEGFDDRQWTIVWEEGAPDEWTNRLDGRVAAPAGTYFEAVNHLQLAISCI
jgi:hypothetical protein